MKKLKDFGKTLSRNEMRNVNGGLTAPYHSCFVQPDCNFQSAGITCNSGNPPVCHATFCTDTNGHTSTDYTWGCYY